MLGANFTYSGHLAQKLLCTSFEIPGYQAEETTQDNITLYPDDQFIFYFFSIGLSTCILLWYHYSSPTKYVVAHCAERVLGTLPYQYTKKLACFGYYSKISPYTFKLLFNFLWGDIYVSCRA